MINPDLMKLLDSFDTLEILRDSVKYQLEKMQNVEKSTDGKEWHEELPQIVREKFDNYRKDYEKLSLVLKSEIAEITSKMNEGYYYWRLLRSACATYRNDLIEYDQQLIHEFNLKETKEISNNSTLNHCLGVLEQHVIEE